jgi:hypothetical protein
VKFRNCHIADVHSKMNEEVSKIAQEGKKKAGVNVNEMALEDMADIIREMPKYEEMMKKYHIHIELSNKVITAYTKNNIIKLINLEQNIISGLDADKNKINNTDLVLGIS